MIIGHKYTTVNEIDPEFIPSIEELLSDRLPSFSLIKDFEEKSDESTFFNYYLFFGNQGNSPIGFAQVEIQDDNLEKQSKFKLNFLKKKTLPYRKLKWRIPGSLEEGVVFSPKYARHALEKTQSIFNELQVSKEVHSQELKYNSSFEKIDNQISQLNSISNVEEYSVPDSFLKSFNNYESYFSALETVTQTEVKKLWKMVYKDLGLDIKEYTSFKDCFSYKTEGSHQYKELRSLEKIKAYQKLDNKLYFQTLESKSKVFVVIIYIEGKNGHLFYDFLNIENHLSNEVIHQMAIMKFYDFENFYKLHTLTANLSKEDSESLIRFGYSSRKQMSLTSCKN